MPYVTRYIITNFVLGVLAGWGFIAVCYWHDAFGIASMVTGSASGWIAGAMIGASVGGFVGVAFTATALEFLAAES